MRRIYGSSGPFPTSLVAIFLLAATAACGASPERCIFSANADGTTTMSCPDGSHALLRPTDQQQPAGGIRGTARLFGRDTHAGIRVELVSDGGISAVTDEAGRFLLEDVPAGHHELTFSATGYEEAKAKDLIVLPGAWATGDVELRMGRQLLGGAEWSLIPAPVGSVFLARAKDGELHLVDPLAVATRRIAGEVTTAEFSPDGRLVIFRTARGKDGRSDLYVHNLGNRETTKLAERVSRWELTADGETFVFEKWSTSDNVLDTWHVPSGRRAPVGRNVSHWRLSRDGGALQALVVSKVGLTLVVWDLAATGGTGLGSIRSGRDDVLPGFGPDDRSFVFITPEDDGLLWDGSQHEVVYLEAGITGHAFNPNGESILYFVGPNLVHLDLRTWARVEITSHGWHARFSPTGKELAWVKAETGVLTLNLWDLEGRSSRPLGAIHAPFQLSFDPTGAYIYLDTDRGLYRWSEAGLQELSANPQGLPQFSPDGRSMLFHEREELLWSETGGTEFTSLGGPILGYPTTWSPDGTELLYLIDRNNDRSRLANAWIFRRASRQRELVATAVLAELCQFLPDGSLLALRRYDGNGNRGELARGDAVVATGVKRGYRFTPDADRILFLTDGLPVSEELVLALWEKEEMRHERARPGEEPVERGGLVPVDSEVGAYLLGPDFIAWVSARTETDSAGLYVSHFPRDLPPLDERKGEPPSNGKTE